MAYDVYLIEKPLTAGLTPSEVCDAAQALKDQMIPIEIENRYGDSIALGFITVKASEEKFCYDHTELNKFVADILSDMEKENPLGEYFFAGLRIYIGR